MANNNQSSGGLFGNKGNSSQSIFGSGQNSGTNPTGGGLFGQTPATSGTTESGQTPSLFGNTNSGSTGASLFGQANSNSGGSTPGGLLSGAGGKQGPTFSFGNKPPDSTPQGNSSTNLFGASTPNKTSSSDQPGQTQTLGLFGGGGTSTPNKPSSLFNTSTTPAGPPPSNPSASLFGASSKPSGGLFAPQQNKSQAPTQNDSSANQQINTSTAFGQATKPTESQNKEPSTSSPFGQTPQKPSESSSGQTAPSLFSSPAKPAEGSKPGSSSAPSLFASPSTTAQPTQSLFGAQQNNAATNPTPATSAPAAANDATTLGSQQQTNGAQTSGLSLFNKPATSQSVSTSGLSGATPQVDTPKNQTSTSLFGAKQDSGLQQTSASTPTPSLFGAPQASGQSQSTTLFGATPTGPTNRGEAPATSGDSDISKSTPGATQPAPSLFGAPKSTAEPEKPSTTGATSGTATLGATTGSNAPASNLGSSTAGPAPSAASRLKNKSMDEIITRWSSDLIKYQKDFQVQAEKVATWDRQLVANSNAISKLYSRTFQAERDTAEVQKQLTAVEGQQDELAAWLEQYEKEIDEMLARQVGQGDGMQGPDQERERTYRTAERVSERLNEMNRDLTGMIEEINSASASISKTSNADDPLSHIVRILNSHLSELQRIDTGTMELKKRVAEAQRDSQRLNSRGLGGLGYDAADDFGRTFRSTHH